MNSRDKRVNSGRTWRDAANKSDGGRNKPKGSGMGRDRRGVGSGGSNSAGNNNNDRRGLNGPGGQKGGSSFRGNDRDRKLNGNRGGGRQQHDQQQHSKGGFQAKNNTSGKSSSVGVPQEDLSKSNYDRLIYATMSMVGSLVGVLLVDGTVIEAIFNSFKLLEDDHSRHKILLKLPSVKWAPPESKHNNPSHTKRPETLVLMSEKYVCLWALQLESLRESPSSRTGVPGFITDADISSKRAGAKDLTNLIGRDLQVAGMEWTNDEVTTNVTLDERAQENHTEGSWDQFEANKRLFNVQSTYDENLYTTALPGKDKLDNEKVKRAEKLAHEIENRISSNPHIQEERNQASAFNSKLDSEDRYSGVLGSRADTLGNIKKSSADSAGSWRKSSKKDETLKDGKATESATESVSNTLKNFSSRLNANSNSSTTSSAFVPSSQNTPSTSTTPSSNATTATVSVSAATTAASGEHASSSTSSSAKTSATPAAAATDAAAKKTPKKKKLVSKLNAKSSVFVPGGAKSASSQAATAARMQAAAVPGLPGAPMMGMNAMSRQQLMYQQARQQALLNQQMRGGMHINNINMLAYQQQMMMLARQQQMQMLPNQGGGRMYQPLHPGTASAQRSVPQEAKKE